MNNFTGESKKHFMNVTADISKQLGNLSFVEKKEKDIRSDVSLRNTDLLRKVFAKQDK